MKTRMWSTRDGGICLAAVCALLVGCAQSPDAGGSGTTGTTLRGARDIAGIWVSSTFSFSFDPSVEPGQLQKVSLQPEYDARYRAYVEAIAKGETEGKPVVDNVTLCLPTGMPTTMMAFFPMEIIVTEKTIFVLPEGVDPPRRIFMDGRSIPPPDDLNPTFGGLSVGRWEGNTLVVETAGIKTSTNINGVPHSGLMRISERIRLVDDDTLEAEFTLTDPEAFKAPWVIKKQYKDYNALRALGMGGRPPKDPGKHPDHGEFTLVASEYICNENNRNLPDEKGVVGATLGGR